MAGMPGEVHAKGMVFEPVFFQPPMNLKDAILEIGPLLDVIAPAEQDISNLEFI